MEANLFYTQQEYSRAEKMEKKISWMNRAIKCSRSLWVSSIKDQLGKEVPIIVHELEYYDLPIKWTTRSNPKPLIDEFLKYHNDGCL